MKNLKNININSILFMDIEAAPCWLELADAPADVQHEWIYKFKFRDDAPPVPLNPLNTEAADYHTYFDFFAELWRKSAGLYAEFSRVVCISFGFMDWDKIRIKSIAHENEALILSQFSEIVNQIHKKDFNFKLCAHNGKEYDFPFLIRRMLLHRQQVPDVLDVYGLKPWEMTTLLDTLEIWRFGSRTGAGLPAIALHFGIPTPKDDISGADVSACFHRGEIERIAIYCAKDVVTLANVFKSMRCEAIFTEDQIVYV